MKTFCAALLLLGLITALIVACAGSDSSRAGVGTTPVPTNVGTTPTPTANHNIVYLIENRFAPQSITISKGSSLTVDDDGPIVHTIKNGTWENTTMKLYKESGAPIVNVMFMGDDTHTIGPFNTAGTFQLICTIHIGMNLTV